MTLLGFLAATFGVAAALLTRFLVLARTEARELNDLRELRARGWLSGSDGVPLASSGAPADLGEAAAAAFRQGWRDGLRDRAVPRLREAAREVLGHSLPAGSPSVYKAAVIRLRYALHEADEEDRA